MEYFLSWVCLASSCSLLPYCYFVLNPCPELIDLVHDQSVNLSSPNWPQPYEPGQYHLWNISGPESSVILLHFHDYSLALQSLLSIFEGHDVANDSTMLAHFSHTDTPSNVRSYTNKVSVRFHAGAYVGTRGFLFQVTVLNSNGNTDW